MLFVYRIAHNHPSGDPAPSREDIEISKKLTEAGKMIGAKLVIAVMIPED